MLQQDCLVGITDVYKATILHVPHAHKSIHCLLVRAGDQQLLIPFDQIQRISNEQQEQPAVRYSLQELLGFPRAEQREPTAKPLDKLDSILLELSRSGEAGAVFLIPSTQGRILQVGIVVDEILAEQECIVKPLAPYLQRPGLMGTTIDGKGRVLLIVDLSSLLSHSPSQP
jgi:chemotaxis protein histidine kinase CheA